MHSQIYRYRFSDTVPMDEVESSLLLAIMATESLHGESQVRLDAGHFLDKDRREMVIDGRTTVGQDLNRLFVGYASREFGRDEFEVERAEDPVVEAVA